MSADEPVTIEVPDTWDRVTKGDTVPLRLIIRRPAEQNGIVTIRNVGHRNSDLVQVDNDFFQGDITLSPGESYALTFGVRFLKPGPAEFSEFFVQVDSQLINVPGQIIQVVPSLDRGMEIRVDRICEYTHGVKLEIVVRNDPASGTTWKDFEVSIGPSDQSRAGVTNHRRPEFAPGQEERLETVLAGQTINISLAGTTNGERVTFEYRQKIPAGSDAPTEFAQFTFLNPRELAKDDRITIRPLIAGQIEKHDGKVNQDGAAEIRKVQGLFPVVGGGTQYLVKIKPNVQARDVNLLSAKGQVEVERMNSQGQDREFQVTVVDHSLFTEPVRLYYDVLTAEGDLRGELYLLIRPTSSRLWILALTAGTAITIKGLTAVVPTFLTPDHNNEWLHSIPELLEKQWTDWLQLLSIPLIRLGLGILDRVVRFFRGI